MKKAMDMKLLCKVISETAGFFEKRRSGNFAVYRPILFNDVMENNRKLPIVH